MANPNLPVSLGIQVNCSPGAFQSDVTICKKGKVKARLHSRAGRGDSEIGASTQSRAHVIAKIIAIGKFEELVAGLYLSS